MNPLNILKNFFGKGGNPQQLLMKAIAGNTNPMIENLVSMAKSGNTQGIETFARNYFKERGRDFDKEFADFMQNMK